MKITWKGYTLLTVLAICFLGLSFIGFSNLWSGTAIHGVVSLFELACIVCAMLVLIVLFGVIFTLLSKVGDFLISILLKNLARILLALKFVKRE